MLLQSFFLSVTDGYIVGVCAKNSKKISFQQRTCFGLPTVDALRIVSSFVQVADWAAVVLHCVPGVASSVLWSLQHPQVPQARCDAVSPVCRNVLDVPDILFHTTIYLCRCLF